MKKVLLIAAIAFASVASAQKGTFLVQGSLGFGSNKDSEVAVPSGTRTEDKMNNFNFSPKLGYQFSDHLTVGLDASIGSSKTETTTTPVAGFTNRRTEKLNLFSVGPFLRYTQSLSDIFSMYADLGIGYQAGKQTTETFNGLTTVSVDEKGNGIYAGITPALFINMKKGFGVNISFGGIRYDSFSFDDRIDPATLTGTRDHKINAFNFTFGQTVNIGISKNF